MNILGFNIGNVFERRQSQKARLLTSTRTPPGARFMESVRSLGGIIRGMATMFHGERDFYKVYGYTHRLRYYDKLVKYYRQDIAGRIVNMPADAIWSFPPTIGGNRSVVKTINDLQERLSLWHVLNRADKICGMSDYAVVLIGLDDSTPLDQPVSPTGKKQVTFLQPYSAESCHVQSYVIDPTNPRFGLPEYYSLNIYRGGLAAFATRVGYGNQPPKATAITRVHWTRLVHIAENTLEDDTIGANRLGRVYNLLDDMLKIGGGSAEVYWLNSRGGLHVDVDKDMDLQKEDADDLTAEVDEYTNNLRRVMRTRGVSVSPVNMQVADPTKPFEVTLNLICASEGIPQRLLLGTEAGQLASEQDRANWATTIKQRRTNFAEPSVIRPLLERLAGMGFFTLTNAQKATVQWPEAFQLSPLERAQTAAQQARSAANLVKAIGTPGTPATPDTTDPATGAVIPGQPAVPGTPGIVSLEEAHSIVMLGYNQATINQNDNNTLE